MGKTNRRVPLGGMGRWACDPTEFHQDHHHCTSWTNPIGKSVKKSLQNFLGYKGRMRNLVISRITEALIEAPDLQNELDISPHELNNLSNEELLDLYEEIFGFGG